MRAARGGAARRAGGEGDAGSQVTAPRAGPGERPSKVRGPRRPFAFAGQKPRPKDGGQRHGRELGGEGAGRSEAPWAAHGQETPRDTVTYLEPSQEAWDAEDAGREFNWLGVQV